MIGSWVWKTSTSKSGQYHLHTARDDPTSASFATLPLPGLFCERAKCSKIVCLLYPPKD